MSTLVPSAPDKMSDEQKPQTQPPTPPPPTEGAPAKQVLEQLKQLERTTGGSGAIPLAPKQMMLDASDVAQKHPDLHLRWVNIKDPQRAATQIMKGYRRLEAEEGGRALGDELALFGISRERFEVITAHNRKVHNERLSAHTKEMENIADAVARELRDRHGIRVDPSRILVNEQGR